jgi:hypothetical protein
MPKAEITSKDGTKIVVDGTPEEIARIIEDVRKKDERRVEKSQPREQRASSRTATDYILELREQGYFNKPKSLGEIKDKLAEAGLIYPITSLSGVVLAQVRKKNLGRIKKEGVWGYVRR